MAQLATKDSPLPAHVLEVVAQRSGGNPQFLRDLLRFAIQSGGIVGLPDSAEAATLARIDALAPDDRAVVRRAAVFGLTFHPRMLAWFDGEDDPPPPADDTWARLADLFDEDGDGYLRFRQSLLRDTAYEGLPFKLRRRLHMVGRCARRGGGRPPGRGRGHPVAALLRGGRVRVRMALRARSPRRAPRRPTRSSKRRTSTRARSRRAASSPTFRRSSSGGAGVARRRVVPGRGVPQGPRRVHRPRRRRSPARNCSRRTCCSSCRASRRSSASTPRRCAGSTARARRSRARRARGRAPERAGQRLVRDRAAGAGQFGTRRCEWAERAAREGEELDDPEVIGDAYMVMGWASAALGKEGAEALMLKSLEAYKRSGNRVRQASILSNLGGTCYWEGRWDDAMSYYERGRDESVKVGNRVNAAAASMNIAEILSDRGELAEAETTLQQTLPVWKSSEYRYFHGACIWMLGPRVAAREQARRGARALRRGEGAADRGRRRARDRGHRRADRRVPPAQERPRRRARARRRDPRARGRLGRRRPAHAAPSTACAATRC